MAWIVYPITLIDSLLGPKELDAIRLHLGEDGRAVILRKCVTLVRSYCAGKGRELGPADSIPEECEHALAALYRHAMLAGAPGTMSLMTEARRDERTEALKFLRDVATGVVAISRPAPVTAGPPDLTGNGPVSPSICAPPRRFDRPGLDGF